MEPGECLALPRREIWGAREQLHPPEGDLSSCSIPKDAESTLGMLGGSWGGLQEEIPAAAPPAPILIPKGFPGVRSLEHFPHDFSVPSHSQRMSWVLPDAELITAVRSEEHKHERNTRNSTSAGGKTPFPGVPKVPKVLEFPKPCPGIWVFFLSWTLQTLLVPAPGAPGLGWAISNPKILEFCEPHP